MVIAPYSALSQQRPSIQKSGQGYVYFGVPRLAAAGGCDGSMLEVEESFLPLEVGMFEPLKQLREKSGLSQADIARRTGLSTNKISLSENGLSSLSRAEEESVRKAILEATNEKAAAVLLAADPRFAVALREIEGNPSKKKLFDNLCESRGYSPVQAAVLVLGRNYPC
ncbi:MAG: helix-turn-helix domain-containing protein [Terriglobales bacterium]